MPRGLRRRPCRSPGRSRGGAQKRCGGCHNPHHHVSMLARAAWPSKLTCEAHNRSRLLKKSRFGFPKAALPSTGESLAQEVLACPVSGGRLALLAK